MTTNYDGTIDISGSIHESNGAFVSITADLGITLSANLDSSGTGTASETVNGTMSYQYSGSYGVPGYSGSIPFDFSTPTIPFQLGGFQINENLPDALLGSQFGVSLDGSVTANQQAISENMLVTLNGVYAGVSFYGTFSGAGTLLSTTPPLVPPEITGTAAGQTTTDTTSLDPLRNVAITDANANQTETVTVTLSNPANGSLEDQIAGTYNASTGTYTVSGTASSVTTALDNLVFTPTPYQSAAGQTVTTTFTIAVTDTAGKSAIDSTTSVVTSETSPPANGWALSLVASFDGTNGSYPSGGLLADANGDLFGTTQWGGAMNAGTVFEIVKSGGAYAGTPKVIANFNITGGLESQAGLIADSAGDLFGTTVGGGADGDGAVFELPFSAGAYATAPVAIASFDATDGEDLYGKLLADSHGDLFGTTQDGDTYGDGTVFEIPYSNGSYANTPTTLVVFNGYDGFQPDSTLIADAAGNLYGTTSEWGRGVDGGTVFEVAKTANGYASQPITLVSFDGANGGLPTGTLLFDAAGDIFGTTAYGGANGDGTVFEIPKIAGAYAATPTTLAYFNSTDGATPGNLMFDPAGNLIGTTSSGGKYGNGTVFELAKTATGYATTPATLVDIASGDGGTPSGGLVAVAGNYFGTTAFQSSADGAVFEMSVGGTQPPPTQPGQVTVAGAAGDVVSVQFADTLIGSAAASVFAATNTGVTDNTVIPFTFTTGAAIPTVAAGLFGALLTHTGGVFAIPAGYTAFASDATAPVTVSGGAANGEAILAGTAGLAYNAGAGTASVFAAGGNNLLSAYPGAGNQAFYPGDGDDTVVMLGGDDFVDGGTGANEILTGQGSDTVATNGTDLIAAGAIGNATITAGSNNPVVFFGPGSTLFNAGSGHATVVSTVGTATVNAQGGTQIWLGSGHDLVNTAGADTIIGNTGAATVNATAGNSFLFAGAGPLTYTGGSGTDTILGSPTGDATLQGGQGSIIALSYAATSYTGGTGASTIAGFGGSLTVTGGAGNGLYLGGPAGHNAITGGSGQSIILGGGPGDVLTAGTGPGDVIEAGAGAETINAAASTGANKLYAGAGPDVIIAGSGSTNVLTSTGNATLVAGSGLDLFAFVQGNSPSVTITNFNAANDYLSFVNFPAGTGNAALAGATTSNGSESLTLPDGTHILLQGFTGLAATNLL